MNNLTTDILQMLAIKGDLNEYFHSGNSAMGAYSRTVKTEYGKLHVQIFRDRNREIKQQTNPTYKRTNDILEETVIHFFRKGTAMSEIAVFIEKMYGPYYTPQKLAVLSQKNGAQGI